MRCRRTGVDPAQGGGPGQDGQARCRNARAALAGWGTEPYLDIGRGAGCDARSDPDAQTGDGCSEGRQAAIAQLPIAARSSIREWWLSDETASPMAGRAAPLPVCTPTTGFRGTETTPIDQTETRVATLGQAIEEAIQTWRFAAVVDALRAPRGVNTTIAATDVAEIGDITRFESPRQLLAWLGLVPSEQSSGTTTRRGRLTKPGMRWRERCWWKPGGPIVTHPRKDIPT